MRIVRKVKKVLRKLNMAKHYEKKLIDELKKEHVVLFDIFTEIQLNLDDKNFAQVLKLLKTFEEEFLEHIEFEDEYFYPYVKTKYKYVPETLSLIQSKQDEMLNISNEVKNFVSRYNSIRKLKTKEFKNDFEKIAKALNERITFEEEKLYSYY